MEYEVQITHRKYIQECIYNDDIQNLRIHMSIHSNYPLLYMLM